MSMLQIIKIYLAGLWMAVFFLTGSSVWAQSTCPAALKGWVHVPSGTTYWGKYKCQSCMLETSAMPDADKVTRCENCGKPHAGESFIAPLTELRGGELYVLDPAGIGETKAAESGLKWKCPNCDSSVFRIHTKCPSCSAPQPALVENDLINENSESLAPLKPSLSNQKSWQIWAMRGSKVLAAVTASAIIWGVQTFSEPGFVSRVDEQEISIKYEHSGNTYTIDLEPEALKSEVRWHQGEPVTLHFSNFYWFQNKQPRGAERSNAEVYAPLFLERGTKQP